MTVPPEEPGRLRAEYRRLAEERDLLMRYIRAKTDDLLVLMKCPTLNADALLDMDLIGYDPIGTISASFARVLENLNVTNRRLQEEVAERARMTEVLRESEEQLRDFFDNAAEFIQIVDPEGRFLYVNRAWRETLGYTEEEVARLAVFDVIAPENREHCGEVFRRLLGKERVSRIETAVVCKDGRRVLLEGNANVREVDGKCVSVRMICHDVTARKVHEEEHLKAQKLESIGVLAGGIAHDFNNLLTGILGNITMASMNAASPGEVRRSMELAERACLRARDLARQLLTFSEGGAPVRKTASVAAILRNSVERLPGGENVRFEIDLPEDLAPVDIDEGQIVHVFGNIVTNARQAMPNGGTVRLSAENATVGRDDLPPLAPGPFVRVSIVDTGVGIPKGVLHRIFDPFYTTKAGGSGLGLATAYSVLRQHGGVITVESEEGKGSAFRVYLPASTAAAAREAAPPEAPREKPRVLVMDDEEMVRGISVQFLEHLGYEASAVGAGEDALEAYRAAGEAGKPFSAVIMDLTIPGRMGGKEAVRRLLDLDPSARAIVSSGYSTDPVMANYRRYGFRGVIAKPFRISELREVLETVLAPAPGREKAAAS